MLPFAWTSFLRALPEERFLIYDRTHGVALVYQPYEARIMPVEHLELPSPDEEEQKYRELWRMFYRTIEVEGRHNPKCRMSHMPKRYWRYMTEFFHSGAASRTAADKLPAEREALLRAGCPSLPRRLYTWNRRRTSAIIGFPAKMSRAASEIRPRPKQISVGKTT